MRSRYKVKLTANQRQKLLTLVRNGSDKAKKIAKQLKVHARTVLRLKERFAEKGLAAALNRKTHEHYKPRKLEGEQDSRLIAICCSKAPEGRACWTLQLFGEALVKLNILDNIS